MNMITRHGETTDLTITNAVGTAKAIPLSDFASAILLVPAGATAATLTFHVSDEQDGTFLPFQAYDVTASTTVAVTGGIAKELPPQLFAAEWLKITASAVGATVAWKISCKA